MQTSVSPAVTASPVLTLTSVTVPARGALTSVSIFIASRVNSVSPSWTRWPTFTLTAQIVPPSGAGRGDPAFGTLSSAAAPLAVPAEVSTGANAVIATPIDTATA